ncbi:hypothetical protein Tco_1067684 [Tanacetum coccineum]|uniref:Uncharacterized protein n=1 Tax=Tanacetum coccineum TaxID=301880 RepID=A0ABQ5HDL1_9ASTR
MRIRDEERGKHRLHQEEKSLYSKGDERRRRGRIDRVIIRSGMATVINIGVNTETSCEYSYKPFRCRRLVNRIIIVIEEYLEFVPRLNVMASFPTRRVNSPSYTSIKARPVFKKDLPRIRGTRGSASKSTTTKSAGNWNFPTFTSTSSAIPIGWVIEWFASSRVIQVGVSSGRESFFHMDNGLRFMLAPRSAKAKHLSIQGKSHGMRNLPGSLSFSGNFLRRTAEQCSFNRVLAISLNFSLFPIKLLSVEANLGMRIKAFVKLISECKS